MSEESDKVEVRDGRAWRLEVEPVLRALPSLAIGVLGDFCLDAYWERDDATAEVSIETGLQTRPVVAQRYSLGGAANVAANLRSLGVGRVVALGVIGDDPFGRELERLLAAAGIETGALLKQSERWQTPVYVKPMLKGKEEARLDLGHGNELAPALAPVLAARLQEVLPELDGMLVNEQLRYGIHTPALHQALQPLIAEADLPLVVDARHPEAMYPACLLKLNEAAARQLLGAGAAPALLARELSNRQGRPVCLTLGAAGCLVATAAGVTALPGLELSGSLDPVGAGDSFAAGWLAALAAGREPAKAAWLGAYAAAVTVQQQGQTGCATPDAVRAMSRSACGRTT